jgi:hypothetical protein
VSAATEFRPLELRLAPEYRRCGVYVAVGYLVIAAVVVGLNLAEVNKTPWANLIAVLAVLAAAPGLLVALAFRYRIRVDEHGVWRRRVVRWDLWPWEAFEGRRVRYGRLGDQLTYPEKPWHSRTISASLLGERNRATFETIVRRYHVPPPPPDVPEELTLRLPMRRTIELSPDGVRLVGPREDGRLVPWQDVVRAEVIRATHDRPDFATLEVHLPARPKPVRLTHQKGAPTWRGADAEVIALFLRRHLTDGQFQVTARRGPPADVAEADRRLARLEAGVRDLRKANRFIRHMVVWSGLLLAVVMFDPWNRPNPVNWWRADWVDAALVAGATAAFIGFHGVLFFGAAHFQARDLRRQRDEVVRWRADQVESAPAT